jgi:hypothetical protein
MRQISICCCFEISYLTRKQSFDILQNIRKYQLRCVEAAKKYRRKDETYSDFTDARDYGSERHFL